MSESTEKERRDSAATVAAEDQATSEESSSPGGCPVEMHKGKLCDRPIYHMQSAYDQTPVCLMHSRDPGKSDAAFQEEFEAILKAAGNGIADFTAFVFPSANYEKREFKAPCVFSGARFAQDAYFYESTFTQDADFYESTFMQDAVFHDATFQQSADFNSTKFTQDADFRKATFVQSAKFIVATFTQRADFISTTFVQGADFVFATFTQLANFNSAAFSGKIRFARAKFMGPVEFRETGFRQDDTTFPGPVFSLAEFSQPEAVVFYKTYLGQALFHNCDVSKVNFSSVQWRRRKGSRKWMVFEEEVNREAAPELKPPEGSADKLHYWLIVELYQKLKKNYDERQDYGTAGDFHYGELEMKRLASRRKNKIVRWLVQHLRLVALYKYASQYGESYVRPGVLFVATLFLFALVYPVAGLRYDRTNDHPGKGPTPDPIILSYADPKQPNVGPIEARVRLFGSSLLTSLEIAAFQKEPAYQPVHPWGRVLGLVEMLLTSTLAALFFLAVRRQFRR